MKFGADLFAIFPFALLLSLATPSLASKCFHETPGAGCSVSNICNLGLCATHPNAPGCLWTDCSTVCSTGDSGCYVRPTDSGNSCSPKISCFLYQSCDCNPAGACTTDSDCIGANQMCDTATRKCIAKTASQFTKHGNNGTVSCTTYCGGAQWKGGTGFCVSGQLNNFPCGQSTRWLNGYEDLCTCKNSAGQSFFKGGNNGTVSCDTYCQGSQWGQIGTCLGSNAVPVSCAQVPGQIINGAELTCTCQGS